MPSFTGEEATNYDERIKRLVPGYDLLHQLTAAQCQVQLQADAKVLVVGAGTGSEIVNIALANPHMQFVAQDTSQDMLNIAQARFEEAGISDRVTCSCTELTALEGSFDAALCLLVMHFVADDGGKFALLQSIRAHLKGGAWLWLADLMQPLTPFERDAQFKVCEQLGLSEAGVQRTKGAFEHEFYALNRMRLAELLEQTEFGAAHCYFKALSFTGFAIRCQ